MSFSRPTTDLAYELVQLLLVEDTFTLALELVRRRLVQRGLVHDATATAVCGAAGVVANPTNVGNRSRHLRSLLVKGFGDRELGLQVQRRRLRLRRVSVRVSLLLRCTNNAETRRGVASGPGGGGRWDPAGPLRRQIYGSRVRERANVGVGGRGRRRLRGLQPRRILSRRPGRWHSSHRCCSSDGRIERCRNGLGAGFDFDRWGWMLKLLGSLRLWLGSVGLCGRCLGDRRLLCLCGCCRTLGLMLRWRPLLRRQRIHRTWHATGRQLLLFGSLNGSIDSCGGALHGVCGSCDRRPIVQSWARLGYAL